MLNQELWDWQQRAMADQEHIDLDFAASYRAFIADYLDEKHQQGRQ
ncbi:MAG: hypothetical protein HC827_13465 [Cyanobacteria bacterium RM1_2_2]|nr:hypothetical protein [Cyanobacteria bacterium RM1_2_2]